MQHMVGPTVAVKNDDISSFSVLVTISVFFSPNEKHIVDLTPGLK